MKSFLPSIFGGMLGYTGLAVAHGFFDTPAPPTIVINLDNWVPVLFPFLVIFAVIAIATLVCCWEFFVNIVWKIAPTVEARIVKFILDKLNT